MTETNSSRLSRRDMCFLLPALAASASFAAEDTRLVSKAYAFEDLKPHANGKNRGWQVLSGETHTGYCVAMHETELAPGQMPHPPHHHAHEEVFMMREGTLEVTVAGQTTKIGPGSAAFIASNDEHGVKNTGDTPVRYFVFELGNDQA